MGFISISNLLQQTTQTSRTSRPAKSIQEEKHGIYQHFELITANYTNQSYQSAREADTRVKTRYLRTFRVISANHAIQSYQLACQTERRIKTQHLGASHAYFSKPSKPVVLVGPSSQQKVKKQRIWTYQQLNLSESIKLVVPIILGTGIKEMDTTVHTTVTVKTNNAILCNFSTPRRSQQHTQVEWDLHCTQLYCKGNH